MLLSLSLIQQLEKLLKNPEKELVVTSGPTEKTIRPPRETMKNVQGSSAGVSLALAIHLLCVALIYYGSSLIGRIR
jgi:hypothetical protein